MENGRRKGRLPRSRRANGDAVEGQNLTDVVEKARGGLAGANDDELGSRGRRSGRGGVAGPSWIEWLSGGVKEVKAEPLVRS